MQNLKLKDHEHILKNLEEKLEQQRKKPFVISIMGQTGVGKSSLINALFNTKLKTDPVRPTTKDVKPVIIEGANGRSLIFNDLPGIGESKEADTVYFTLYQKYLEESDVVIWAIHADNRSTTFDEQAFERFLKNLEPEKQSLLMSRITFVLTKADVLAPPAWNMGYLGNYVVFKPSQPTREILKEKADYYQEKFIRPYGANIVSWTYNDVNFALEEPPFKHTKYGVYYQGLLTEDRVFALRQRYPQYKEVFDRLYDNYRVIPCSSLFRYNLDELLLTILNKLGTDAIERFKQFIAIDTLNQVPLSRARQLCNLVIIDIQRQHKMFDLCEDIFPK